MRENFIVRKPNPEDGRSVLITLTEEGLRMRDISKHFVLQFNESINNHIEPEKMQIFLEVIYKINQLINLGLTATN